MNEGGQPKLVSRREHKKSTLRQGRTIGAKRERLETANERAAARKKDKHKKTLRVTTSIILFAMFVAVVVVLVITFVSGGGDSSAPAPSEYVVTYNPTIEIVDESSSSNDKITSHMKEYIGQVETAFKEKDYKPIRAVIPVGSIREIHFYLDGYNGYFKMITDRGAGVSVEDADRMLRYLTEQGKTEFEYIDVRIDGRAFWR
ncbi:hypothetical protein IKE98_03685 [Candidatus Saccharibacteria bacterium]|nr:hypothetical protein [Candidatus Saccharibacteria bacterium]